MTNPEGTLVVLAINRDTVEDQLGRELRDDEWEAFCNADRWDGFCSFLWQAVPDEIDDVAAYCGIPHAPEED